MCFDTAITSKNQAQGNIYKHAQRYMLFAETFLKEQKLKTTQMTIEKSNSINYGTFTLKNIPCNL